jgi:hypothetical protein
VSSFHWTVAVSVSVSAGAGEVGRRGGLVRGW